MNKLKPPVLFIDPYKSHAMTEFRAAGWIDDNGQFHDEMQQMICEHVMKLLEVFGDEGHSGSSSQYAVRLFEKLAMFKPIVPLTGEDHEWTEVHDGVWQNKRCGSVFKERDGRAYNIDGRVFREPDGCCYTSWDSRVYIDFPYTPTTEYVDVPTAG